ncbi:MAG: acyltransferase family protein [Janthinobacterium lividum]
MPRPLQERFNPNVHGARGIFSSMVFLFHTVNSGLTTFSLLQFGVAYQVFRTSEYGVELFFCISGLVIAGSLASRASVSAFLRDRAIRILPVLWATFVVIVPLGWLSHKAGSDFPLATLVWLLPANMLVLPGVLPLPDIHGAAWSLSYEWLFYLVCAAAWFLGRRRGSVTAGAVMAPIVAALVCFYPRGLFFLSGVLVLWTGAWVPLAVRRYPVAWIALFLAAWNAVQRASPENITSYTLFDWAGDARFPLALLAFAAATIGFAGLAGGHGVLGWLLRTRLLQWLGTISYSFYLWHPIVMAVTKQELTRSGLAVAAGSGAQMLLFLVALPPSLLVAAASQRLIERQFGQWLQARSGLSTRQLAVDPPEVSAAFPASASAAVRR